MGFFDLVADYPFGTDPVTAWNVLTDRVPPPVASPGIATPAPSAPSVLAYRAPTIGERFSFVADGASEAVADRVLPSLVPSPMQAAGGVLAAVGVVLAVSPRARKAIGLRR